jgi:hypothetical protein
MADAAAWSADRCPGSAAPPNGGAEQLPSMLRQELVGAVHVRDVSSSEPARRTDSSLPNDSSSSETVSLVPDDAQPWAPGSLFNSLQ